MSILNFNPHLLLMSQSRISYCSFYFAQLWRISASTCQQTSCQ
jgi:hypothetical protein